MPIQAKIKILAAEIGADITKIEDAVHAFLVHILHLGKNDEVKAQTAADAALVHAQLAVDSAAAKLEQDVLTK